MAADRSDWDGRIERSRIIREALLRRLQDYSPEELESALSDEVDRHAFQLTYLGDIVAMRAAAPGLDRSATEMVDHARRLAAVYNLLRRLRGEPGSAAGPPFCPP
jgi:hypothetical protein